MWSDMYNLQGKHKEFKKIEFEWGPCKKVFQERDLGLEPPSAHIGLHTRGRGYPDWGTQPLLDEVVQDGGGRHVYDGRRHQGEQWQRQITTAQSKWLPW